MKQKFFTNTNTSILKTNILRLMVSEVMKALELVTDEMVKEKTSGYELYFDQIIAMPHIEHKRNDVEYSVYIDLLVRDFSSDIQFYVPYKVNNVLPCGWTVSIDYETETVGYTIINEGHFKKKDLIVAFGKNFKAKYSDMDGACGEELEICISMKAFPEIFS